MRKSKIIQKGLSQDVILELRGMSFSHFALHESCDETKGSIVLANAAMVFFFWVNHLNKYDFEVVSRSVHGLPKSLL